MPEKPDDPGAYVIRVGAPGGTKLMPHRHPEDRICTVMSGVFYIGLGEQVDGDKVKAYPPRSRIRFCFVRRASSHAFAITPACSIACKEEEARHANDSFGAGACCES